MRTRRIGLLAGTLALGMVAAGYYLSTPWVVWAGTTFGVFALGCVVHGEPAMSVDRVTPLARVYAAAGTMAGALNVYLGGRRTVHLTQHPEDPVPARERGCRYGRCRSTWQP